MLRVSAGFLRVAGRHKGDKNAVSPRAPSCRRSKLASKPTELRAIRRSFAYAAAGRSCTVRAARSLIAAAVSLAKHREVVVEDPSALTRVQYGAPTLAQLIRWYIDTFETISKWQRSKQAHLEFLERHALGKSNALTLTSAALIDHVRSRRANGAGPLTVANDLIWSGVVLRAARSVKELPVRPEIVQEARNACAELHRRAARACHKLSRGTIYWSNSRASSRMKRARSADSRARNR